MSQAENSPHADKFFLFIGGTTSDAATSVLKTAGIYYRQKMLQSTPRNWSEITTLLRDDSLIGAVGKLTNRQFAPILTEEYERVAEEMFDALAATQHALFVHQALLTGEGPVVEDIPEPEDESYIDHLIQTEYFRPPKDSVRRQVLELLEGLGVNIVPYQTNAEMSVLAARFVEDHKRNLLFRLYVPTGRIYSKELERILTLFRDWLAQATNYRVRQDGYATPRGQVFEFYGDDRLDAAELDRQFETFTSFLALCEQSPADGVAWLVDNGIDKSTAEDLVRRYAKEAKRLALDIRHEKESRLLSLRQRFESELVDATNGVGVVVRTGEELLEALVPANLLNPPLAVPRSDSDGVVVYQQNIIGPVSTVVQSVRGSSDLGPDAQGLLTLIEEHGRASATALESDLHEVEDEDAPSADRLAARQRLKGFLFKLGGKVEDAALAALLRYLETKVGL